MTVGGVQAGSHLRTDEANVHAVPVSFRVFNVFSLHSDEHNKCHKHNTVSARAAACACRAARGAGVDAGRCRLLRSSLPLALTHRDAGRVSRGLSSRDTSGLLTPTAILAHFTLTTGRGAGVFVLLLTRTGSDALGTGTDRVPAFIDSAMREYSRLRPYRTRTHFHLDSRLS